VFHCLDFLGIILLICGSNFSVIYYAFYCDRTMMWSYISAITAMGVLAFFITTLPRYQTIAFRRLRLNVFLGLGVSGAIPFVHMFIRDEPHLPVLAYVILMGAIYLAGAAIYLYQVPERWFPGTFDIFGNSHQLWHIAVAAAIVAHYFATLRFYEYRMYHTCPPS